MAGKTTMAEPAKHVPAQTPARHTDGQCGFGAEGVPPTRARGLRTAHQTVDHLRRPLQRPEMMIAVVAHVHAAEFIPLSFWYDAPLISPYSDRRHDPWLVCGS